MKVAEKIKNLRLDKNWSQEYVANELCISQSTYSTLENGQTKLTIDRAESLAELYAVDPAYFFSTTHLHINIGSKSNSNSGYIQNYNSRLQESINLKDSNDQLLKAKNEEISLLRKQIQLLRDNLTLLQETTDLLRTLSDLNINLKNPYLWFSHNAQIQMAHNLVLETLLENYKVSVDEVASKTEIPPADLEDIRLGKKQMTIPYAEKLGIHFGVYPEMFFKTQSDTTHLNYGDKANSSSGYIVTYHNESNELLISRLDEENKKLKARIAKLERQTGTKS